MRAETVAAVRPRLSAICWLVARPLPRSCSTIARSTSSRLKASFIGLRNPTRLRSTAGRESRRQPACSPQPSVAHLRAAVDVIDLPVDPGAVVGGEERYHRGDVLGLAEPPVRHRLQASLDIVAGQMLLHRFG